MGEAYRFLFALTGRAGGAFGACSVHVLLAEFPTRRIIPEHRVIPSLPTIRKLDRATSRGALMTIPA
jgi:hypothetical protein